MLPSGSESPRTQGAKEAWVERERKNDVEEVNMESIVNQIEVMDLMEAIGMDGYDKETALTILRLGLRLNEMERDEETERDGLIFAAFNWGNWKEVWDDSAVEHEPVLGIDLSPHPRMSPHHRRECLKCWPQLEQLLGSKQDFLISLHNSKHRDDYPHLEGLMRVAVHTIDQFALVNEYRTVTWEHVKRGLASDDEVGARRRVGPPTRMGKFNAVLEDMDNVYRDKLWAKKREIEYVLDRADTPAEVKLEEVDIDVPKPSDLIARAMRAFVLKSRPEKPFCLVCERRKALKQAMRPFRRGRITPPPTERHDVLVNMLHRTDKDTAVSRGDWMDEVAMEYTAFEEEMGAKAGEIDCPPFGAQMRKALLDCKKQTTVRYQPLGEPGNWFRMGSRVFTIAYVEQLLLRDVAKRYYKLDGFESPVEFLEYWVKLHGDQCKGTRKEAIELRKRGRRVWHFDDKVYVHFLMEPWNSSPIREFNSPVLHQDEFITSGLGEEMWEMAKCLTYGRELADAEKEITAKLSLKVNEIMDWNDFVRDGQKEDQELRSLYAAFDRAVNRAHRARTIGEDRVFNAQMEAERNRERDLVLKVARRTPRTDQRVELVNGVHKHLGEGFFEELALVRVVTARI